MSDNPLLHDLGYGPGARLVLFHADDIGMSHGSNRAFLDLSAAGIIQSGSVMVPCPWSQETFQAVRADSTLDLGVHLTLNAEWPTYRWGPVSTRDPASGLIDPEGWFWHRPPLLLEHLNAPAAINEMRAQIDLARRNGLDFTHLDTHMGAALSAPLLAAYITLGFEYNVPVLLPRAIDEYVERLAVEVGSVEAYLELVKQVEARGMPLVDTFRITPGYDPQGSEGGRAELYEAVLHDLPPGITYFSLHPNAPGDIEAISPDRAHWRTFEYEYFASQRLRDFLAAEGIVPIGYRAIRRIMRERRAQPI